MNDVGLIDINKLITVCIENIELRKSLLSITTVYNKLKNRGVQNRSNIC